MYYHIQSHMKKQVQCKQCQKSFDKELRHIISSPNHFCSRSCANRWTNIHVKWKDHIIPKYICNVCGNERDGRAKTGTCLKCQNAADSEKCKQRTIKEVKEKNKHRMMWYTSEIRNFARSWNPTLVGSPCQHCGYDVHTEICHIKPIKEFDDLTPLCEVNRSENLVVLCPNHHWEFDNGILVLPAGLEPATRALEKHYSDPTELREHSYK